MKDVVLVKSLYRNSEEYLTKEDFIKKYPLFSKEVGL